MNPNSPVAPFFAHCIDPNVIDPQLRSTASQSGAAPDPAQSSNENKRKIFLEHRPDFFKRAGVVHGEKQIGRNKIDSSFTDHLVFCLAKARTTFVENKLQLTKDDFIRDATQQNLQTLKTLYGNNPAFSLEAAMVDARSSAEKSWSEALSFHSAEWDTSPEHGAVAMTAIAEWEEAVDEYVVKQADELFPPHPSSIIPQPGASGTQEKLLQQLGHQG